RLPSRSPSGGSSRASQPPPRGGHPSDRTGRPACLRFFFSRRRPHTRSVSAFLLNRSSDLRLATKSNQIKQLIRNGRSASLQRTFKKSFTSFSHSTRNKTRDGLIRVRNIRALNG